ncbi:MAG: hypothetical protein ACXWG7_02510 [Chthoniobacterales bacterium]
MKFIIKNLLSAAVGAALCASSVYATEPTNSPSPSPSPTASPSATPGGDDHSGGSGPTQGNLSLHGLYLGTTSAGGLGVFYIEGNTHIQINILDVAGQSIGFAEGQMTNGAFAFTLSNGQSITGTATEHTITGAIGTATFQAMRTAEFGQDHTAVGRFIGVANGPGGESHVMFVLDGNGHIAMLQTSGTPPNITRTGGFGTVTPSTTAGAPYTFTLNQTIGSSSVITGSFTINGGVFQGTFTTSAGTFTVNSFKSTLVNRMANISTRGLVGQGQGQLIGGFIITGGPKMVLIRALGPSMAALGVSPVLDNPSVKLFANGTLLAQNDDWKTNANVADITATKIAPTNDLEAALLVRLEPGAYTTVVSGSDTSATGIALVEVYEMNDD